MTGWAQVIATPDVLPKHDRTVYSLDVPRVHSFVTVSVVVHSCRPTTAEWWRTIPTA